MKNIKTSLLTIALCVCASVLSSDVSVAAVTAPLRPAPATNLGKAADTSKMAVVPTKPSGTGVSSGAQSKTQTMTAAAGGAAAKASASAKKAGVQVKDFGKSAWNKVTFKSKRDSSKRSKDAAKINNAETKKKLNDDQIAKNNKALENQNLSAGERKQLEESNKKLAKSNEKQEGYMKQGSSGTGSTTSTSGSTSGSTAGAGTSTASNVAPAKPEVPEANLIDFE